MGPVRTQRILWQGAMAKRGCVGFTSYARGQYLSVKEKAAFERECEAVCRACRHAPNNAKHELPIDPWIVTCECSWPGGWADCDYDCTLLVTNIVRKERLTTDPGGQRA